eukprot:9498364-Pyramimonas_sp.AAC.1
MDCDAEVGSQTDAAMLIDVDAMIMIMFCLCWLSAGRVSRCKGHVSQRALPVHLQERSPWLPTAKKPMHSVAT